MNTSDIKVSLCHPEARLPAYQTAGASAFDIHAVNDGLIYAGRSVVFQTGLKFEIPEHTVLLIFSRSGHGFKQDVRLANCVGVLDSDFRGELKVKLTADGNAGLRIEVGDRIAQGILMAAPRVTFTQVEALSETQRGEKGFGHTGQ